MIRIAGKLGQLTVVLRRIAASCSSVGSLACAGAVAAACSAPVDIPRLAPAALVAVHTARPAAVHVLRPDPQFQPRPRPVTIGRSPPLRPWLPPVIVIDDDVWCPHQGPAGAVLPATGVPELSPTEVRRIEVLPRAAAERYAARCAGPADSVVRVLTRKRPVP